MQNGFPFNYSGHSILSNASRWFRMCVKFCVKLKIIVLCSALRIRRLDLAHTYAAGVSTYASRNVDKRDPNTFKYAYDTQTAYFAFNFAKPHPLCISLSIRFSIGIDTRIGKCLRLLLLFLLIELIIKSRGAIYDCYDIMRECEMLWNYFYSSILECATEMIWPTPPTWPLQIADECTAEWIKSIRHRNGFSRHERAGAYSINGTVVKITIHNKSLLASCD